ncbi:MAG: protein kinase [Akkermansiaceae bacterium]|nr:protein kinase [Akkermansiaceae bacterium]
MRITNHDLIRAIGEGGFGEVWLARTVTGKLRAVKVVRREQFEQNEGADADVEHLFQLEFEGVKKFEDVALNHHSLIHIYTVGRGDGGDMFYYVMPLADNAATCRPCREMDIQTFEPLTLDDMIHREGAMPVAQALDFLKGISSGVAAMHEAGLVHRDISSSNILIIDGRPVVADPGLTSFDTEELPAVSRGFSPPEGHSSTASDVYSLGKVFYQMVSGMHPADQYPQLPEAIYQDPRFAEVVDLLDRCCDPQPEARLVDATELLAFLKRMSGGKALPAAGRYRLWPLPLTLILLAIGVWLFLTSRKPESGQELVPPPAYAGIEEGLLSVFAEKNGRLLWKKQLTGTIVQADVIDLDEDGSPEVVCAIRDTGSKETGRLLVYNANGTLRWQHDTTLEFQNYPGFGADQMACFGFKAADLDGKKGKELVVVARNVENWYPTALQFLSTRGKLTACYWHPGHIHPEHIHFFRETANSLPMLSFVGLNNRLSIPPRDYPIKLPAKDLKWRTVTGLLNPRIPGHHAAPPGQGELKGKDSMTLWYRILDPQHARIRSVHCEDTNHDGKNELVIWADFSDDRHLPDMRINYCEVIGFRGKILETKTGDGNVVPAKLRIPGKEDVRSLAR